MNRVIAEKVDVPIIFKSAIDITHFRFEWGELAVTLTSSGDGCVAVVTFIDILGFRLLDEGNLLEYWPECSSENGWLFRILKNGWFDLEQSRSGFLLEKGKGISEYFIASQNNCLSVLSSEIPMVEIYSI